jgi:diguanylate cyclase (GGDEF)-like protein/PAS domain S-box-containing protein
MLHLFRTNLALRSTVFILLIVVLVGAAFLVGAVLTTYHNEHIRQQARLVELLDTVESTVGIAAFLGDKELAREVAAGLLKNQTVSSVVIVAGDSELVSLTRAGASSSAEGKKVSQKDILQRKIHSPFNYQEVVGSIELLPDETEIDRQIVLAQRFIAVMFSVLAAAITIGTVLVVVLLITRPITRISTRLHLLHAETGEKLEFPRGNERDEIGQLVGDVNALIDYLVNILNEERDLRMEREVQERKYRAIFENAETGIFQIDGTGSLLSWNPAFARFFNISRSPSDSAEEPLGLFDLTGENSEDVRSVVRQCGERSQSLSLDIEIAGHGRRRPRWVNLVLTSIEDAALQGIVNDITARKRAEEAASELAHTDALTALGNRLGFERQLRTLIDISIRDPQRRFALLMLDLDKFKQVNDIWGHQAGDEVLKHIAQLLTAVSRKADYAARLGGDEFVLLLDGADSDEKVMPVLISIFKRIHEPIPLSNGEHASVGVSIGIAIFAPGQLGAVEFLKSADEAMFRAKESGRDAWCFAGDEPVASRN